MTLTKEIQEMIKKDKHQMEAMHKQANMPDCEDPMGTAVFELILGDHVKLLERILLFLSKRES